MKEITETKTIIYPTEDEVTAVVDVASKVQNPAFKPKNAKVVSVLVEQNKDEKLGAVYKCLRAAEGEPYRVDTIAMEVVTAYCKANGIEEHSTRILSVDKYLSHYVINAVVVTE